MNKIIALVGMCGTGKSVVAEFFGERGYEAVYFGGATMEIIRQRGLPVNEVNEKLVREELRKEHGMGAYAVINLPKIEGALEGGNVIIDGLYSWSEYKVLKDRFGDELIVVAVVSPRQSRYERLAGRKVRPLTKEEARDRDCAEIENLEKGGPIAIADFYLLNDGTVEELVAELEKLYVEIGG